MDITFMMMIDLDDCHDALFAHDGDKKQSKTKVSRYEQL
jgi:hypothetical protein